MTRITVAGLIGALIALGAAIGAAPPVGAETAVFTAQLLPSSQVPPITNADVIAYGLAVVTLNLTRDASNAITAATADFAVGLTRFPPTDTVVAAHIHQDPVGQNGPIVVDSGISMTSPVSLAGGDTSISRPGLAVSPALAAQILSNPEGFYFNVHTSINTGGSVRGQLAAAGGAFNAFGLAVITDAPTYMAGDPIQLKVLFENAGGPAQADAFAGVALPAAMSSALCPGPNNLALIFLGPTTWWIRSARAT
jgi:CHRD domain